MYIMLTNDITFLIQVNLEIQSRLQDKETSDLTHLDLLGKLKNICSDPTLVGLLVEFENLKTHMIFVT